MLTNKDICAFIAYCFVGHTRSTDLDRINMVSEHSHQRYNAILDEQVSSYHPGTAMPM